MAPNRTERVKLVNVVGLIAALDAKRQALGLSWRSVARLTSVSDCVLVRLRAGIGLPDVSSYAALVVWSEIPPAEVFVSGRAGEAPSGAGVVLIPLYLGQELTPEIDRAVRDLVQTAIEFGRSIAEMEADAA